MSFDEKLRVGLRGRNAWRWSVDDVVAELRVGGFEDYAER